MNEEEKKVRKMRAIFKELEQISMEIFRTFEESLFDYNSKI